MSDEVETAFECAGAAAMDGIHDKPCGSQNAVANMLVCEMIGSGTFANVYKAMVTFEGGRAPRLPGRSLSRLTDATALSSSSSEEASGDESVYYAVKMLHDKALACSATSSLATRDLVSEVNILSKLPPHPNVITLWAVSPNFRSEAQIGYLVLELLHETLHTRLARWRASRLPPSWTIRFSPKQHRMVEQQQLARIADIGLPIAEALSFIHHHKICYRDLKPRNVGFNVAGQIKLFDFGLARECSAVEDGRLMSGLTGTTRYMAPEVMDSASYGTAADVYSFSVLVWETCTLQRPFSGIRSLQAARRLILQKCRRPALSSVYNHSARDLLAAGWHRDADRRPSFALIVLRLKELSLL